VLGRTVAPSGTTTRPARASRCGRAHARRGHHVCGALGAAWLVRPPRWPRCSGSGGTRTTGRWGARRASRGEAGLTGPTRRQRSDLKQLLGGVGLQWSTASFDGSYSTRVGWGVRRGRWPKVGAHCEGIEGGGREKRGWWWAVPILNGVRRWGMGQWGGPIRRELWRGPDVAVGRPGAGSQLGRVAVAPVRRSGACLLR
jgi:hypothetical protein